MTPSPACFVFTEENGNPTRVARAGAISPWVSHPGDSGT